MQSAIRRVGVRDDRRSETPYGVKRKERNAVIPDRSATEQRRALIVERADIVPCVALAFASLQASVVESMAFVCIFGGCPITDIGNVADIDRPIAERVIDAALPDRCGAPRVNPSASRRDLVPRCHDLIEARRILQRRRWLPRSVHLLMLSDATVPAVLTDGQEAMTRAGSARIDQ